MSALWPRWAGRFTRSWTRVYTTGLPRQVARERRDEIASDLWEHAIDAETVGISAQATATQIVGRSVLGMPADIAWHVGELKGDTMETTSQRLTMITWGLIGLLSIVMGILMLVGLSQGNWSAGDAIGAFYVFAMIAGIAGPFIAIAGVHALRRAEAEGQSLTRGRSLLVAGTLGVALVGGAIWWTIIGPLIAIGIVWYWAVKISEWRRDRPATP